MKYSKKIFISIFWVILGAVLLYVSFNFEIDSYWSGLGAALFVVGVSQIARQLRYRVDNKYRENVDTAHSDERNRFIRGRAWAMAGYLYIIIAAVVMIVLQIMGLKEISQILSMTICALLVLFWISYLILNKKY